MNTAKRKAVFLDRDGTLIKHVPFLTDPNLVVLNDGVIDCLNELKKNGYLLIVVTNQSGVARGLYTEAAVHRTNARVQELITEGGGPALDGFYYCPHYSEGVVPEYTLCCTCRKPAPGMIERAATEHDIDIAGSVMIGDSYLKDITMGLALGMRTIFISSDESVKPPSVQATVSDFSRIAEIVLSSRA